MANRELKVELSIEDRKLITGLQKSLNKAKAETKAATVDMKKSWGDYKMAVLGVTAAIAGVAYSVKQMVEAYAIQEKAELDLAAAMKINGAYTRQRWEEYKRFAAEMQKMTTYGDEVILQAMQNLQTYGIKNEEVMKKATKAVLDLAAAKGIDLRTASEIVGKAFTGETGTLTRYGIVIDKGLDKTEKFDAVLNKIAETMGGRATTAAETLSGQIKQLSNSFGDAKEKSGEFLVNLGNLIASKIYEKTGLKGDLKTFIDDWIEGMNILNDKLREWAGKDKKDKVDDITQSIKSQTNALREYKTVIDELDTSSADNLFNWEVNQFQLPDLQTDRFILEIQTQEQYLNSLKTTWKSTMEEIEDAMGSWDDVMAQFGGDIAANLFDLAYAHEFTAGAIVQSLAKLAAGVIRNITQQAAVKAIWELAEAWANYALGNAAAGAMHLRAAGLYGAVTGAGIVAGAALGSVASGASRNNAQTGAIGGGVVIDTIHSTGSLPRPTQPQQPLTIVNVVDKNSFLGLMASKEGKDIVINTVSLDYANNGITRRLIRGGA